jgi:hypothetical protein
MIQIQNPKQEISLPAQRRYLRVIRAFEAMRSNGGECFGH